MKLKQLFCRHKKMTAVGIYEKSLTHSITDVRIVCKCDKCGKEIEVCGREFNYSKHKYGLIDFSRVIEHELWGKWW